MENQLRDNLKDQQYCLKYIQSKEDLADPSYYNAEIPIANILKEMNVSPQIADNPRVSSELHFLVNNILHDYGIKVIYKDNIDKVRRKLQDIFEVDEKGQITYNEIFYDRRIRGFFEKAYFRKRYCIDEKNGRVIVIEQQGIFNFEQDTRYAVTYGSLIGSSVNSDNKEITPTVMNNGNYKGYVQTKIRETSRTIDEYGIEMEKNVISFIKYLTIESVKKGQVLYPDGILTDKKSWSTILNEDIDLESIERRQYVAQEENPMIVSIDIYAHYGSDNRICDYFKFLVLRKSDNFGSIEPKLGKMTQIGKSIKNNSIRLYNFLGNLFPNTEDEIRIEISKIMEEAKCYGRYGSKTFSAMKKKLQDRGILEEKAEFNRNEN